MILLMDDFKKPRVYVPLSLAVILAVLAIIFHPALQ
jgi:hypothetical protein